MAEAMKSDKQNMVAGLLGILVPFGVHKFCIGDSQGGVIRLIVTVVTCGTGDWWSIIEGIAIMVNCGVDAEGEQLS